MNATLTQKANDLLAEYGLTLNAAGAIQNPGRFEGEGPDILYWHSLMMDGMGEAMDGADRFEIESEDREALGDLIPASAVVAVLLYSDSGFNYLEYLDANENPVA